MTTTKQCFGISHRRTPSCSTVNLHRVLRDPDQAAELRRLLELTPFARDEFDASYCEMPGTRWRRRGY